MKVRREVSEYEKIQKKIIWHNYIYDAGTGSSSGISGKLWREGSTGGSESNSTETAFSKALWHKQNRAEMEHGKRCKRLSWLQKDGRRKMAGSA